MSLRVRAVYRDSRGLVMNQMIEKKQKPTKPMNRIPRPAELQAFGSTDWVQVLAAWEPPAIAQTMMSADQAQRTQVIFLQSRTVYRSPRGRPHTPAQARVRPTAMFLALRAGSVVVLTADLR
jgi:hypothetical protein